MGKSITIRPKFGPLETYFNARSFWLALVAIVEYAERNPDDQLHYWPLVVNEAFCLELHLKCLKRLRRRRPSKHHNIQSLFKSLSKVDRKTITGYLNEALARHPEGIEPGISYDVDSILARSKDLFVAGRYWHEGLLPSRDSAGVASNAGAAQLIAAINRRILDARPRWAMEATKAKFKFANLPTVSDGKTNGN